MLARMVSGFGVGWAVLAALLYSGPASAAPGMKRVLDLLDVTTDTVSNWQYTPGASQVSCVADIDAITGTNVVWTLQYCSDFGEDSGDDCDPAVGSADAVTLDTATAQTAVGTDVLQWGVGVGATGGSIASIMDLVQHPPIVWRILADVTSVTDLDATVMCWWD